MARIRSIKPTFWSDEKVALLPRECRLTFLGLISALADDEGRLPGHPKIVRGAIYGYDDDMSVQQVEDHLSRLASSRFIIRYAVNGDPYIAIRKWHDHQKIDRPSRSLLPPPPNAVSSNGSDTFVERSTTIPDGVEWSGVECSGVDGITATTAREWQTKFVVAVNVGLQEHDNPAKRQIIPRIEAGDERSETATKALLALPIPPAEVERLLGKVSRKHNAKGRVSSLGYFVEAVKDEWEVERSPSTPGTRKRGGPRKRADDGTYDAAGNDAALEKFERQRAG